ncbi:MAG: DUF4349 domain-containing protein [Actinomycetota bacterium]|nr:DUF4349 domain-containing protein [Actinomycetota bacterium]
MRLRSDDTMDPEVERELAAIDAALAGEPVAPELAELEALVRTARTNRPRPADEFAKRLNARVQAGFASERDTPRRPGAVVRARLRRRMLLPALGAAATVLLAVVVVTSMLGGSSERGRDLSRPASPLSADPSRLASPQSAAPSAAPSGAAPAQSPRKVERQASLTLQAAPDRIDDVSQQVIRVTDGVDGVVANSSISSGDGSGGASFELRIPTDRLQNALARLSKLARVRSRQEGSRDVTDSFTSAKTRLDDALAERSSLLKQLAAADKPNQAESIRARLRINAQRIMQARSGVNEVRRRTDFATVALTVEARGGGDGTGAGTWTPDDALGDAGRILEVSLGVLVVGLAIALPLAFAVGLAGLTTRVARRRRRERVLASS